MHPIRRAAARPNRIPGGRDGRAMLTVALVDRVGSGLWASVSVLYFTYVSGLSLGEVGTLVAAAGAVGIAGAPLGGRLADRFPLTPVLIAVQLLRAVASLALLTTDRYVFLLAFCAVGSLGDRAANVLTKLYATRAAGRTAFATKRSTAPSRTRDGRSAAWPQRRHSPSATPPHISGSSPATPFPSSVPPSSPSVAANPPPEPAP